MGSVKRKPTIFFIYYFVVFLGQAIQGSFLNLYLSNAGMGSGTIGAINGTVQILGLAIFPVWGHFADRASNKNKVLIFGLILSIGALVGFYFSKNLIMLGAIYIIYCSVHNPMASIYETITMDHVTRNGWDYSPIRMSGTIGYAIMSVIAGFYLSKHEELLFPLFIFVMVLATICAMMLPKSYGRAPEETEIGLEERKREKKQKENIYVMLKNRRVRNVLILFAMYTLSNTFNTTYYGIYMTQLQGGYAYVGIGHMVMALAEIPFHIGPGRRWMKKIGVERALVIVMVAGTIRWTLAALCQSAWMLVVTMAFNGIMLVPTIVGVVEFLYENAPDHLKTSASTTLKSPFMVGGQLIGNLVGGLAVGTLDAAGLPGIRIVYIALAPLCLIAGLIVGIPLIKEDKKKKENPQLKD